MFGIMFIIFLLGISCVAASTPAIGGGVKIKVDTEDFPPLIWMDPESRVVYHNPADGSGELVERVNNYAFEGEKIVWRVLVMDKNGIEKIEDVYATIGTTQGIGNDIEANCDASSDTDVESFNAMIDEEKITTFDADTMRIYDCAFTVETPVSMYGEYFITTEVEDLTGNIGTTKENEYWFLNPVIAMSITGDIDFGSVRPGTKSYSDTLLVENDADAGSGVLLDMGISGTDFYDPASSPAICPESNHLRLNTGGSGLTLGRNPSTGVILTYNPGAQGICDSMGDLSEETDVDPFCYFATNGGYSTANDVVRRDSEGYVGIPYEVGSKSKRIPIITGATAINSPTHLLTLGTKEYFAGNVLTPGDEIAVTFRLYLPMPCNGDFSAGQIMFWGNAI